MSLFEILLRHASERPDATAYVFLDGQGGRKELTFARLSRRVRAIAAQLQAAGAAGQRALLMYQPGLDFIEAILACFAARVIAVPVQPLRRARELPRVSGILGSSGSRFLLTSASTRAAIEQTYPEAASATPGVTWLGTDQVPEAAADAFRREPVDPASVAFLQYTSGSTGAPKGVMVTHANLLHNEQTIQQGCLHDDSTVFVGWLPLFHDMGLIGNVLQPLFLGVKSVLFSPVTFLSAPATWLRAISDWKGTTSGGPSFAYELCVHRVAPEAMQGVDLSSWRVAFNGAEPVKAHVIDAFARKFAPHGFREEAFFPCYGMAEATLIISGASPARKPVRLAVDPEPLARNEAVPQEGSSTVLVGCGTSWEQVVRVVDPETLAALPDGRIGELWVSGPSVAAGYWGQPELTAATFQARTADGEGPFLRTGDLGFRHRGELFITGRLKDLIIIRGANHYPDDLETTVSGSHPALRPGGAAVFTLEGEAGTRLIAVAEVQRTALSRLDDALHQEIAVAARRDVSDLHGLRLSELVLLRPATLPRTTSGKARRGHCRDLYLAGTLERVELPPAARGGAARARSA